MFVNICSIALTYEYAAYEYKKAQRIHDFISLKKSMIYIICNLLRQSKFEHLIMLFFQQKCDVIEGYKIIGKNNFGTED